MDLYSKPVEEISYQDIDQFLQAKHSESEILDYKESWPDHLERLLAAFANTSGGLVLLGVREEEGSGTPVVPAVGIDLSEGTDVIRNRVLNIAFDNIYPPIFPEVAIRPFGDEGAKGVVLIRVPESHETPHATDNRQRVYVRVGSQNRFAERLATLTELEWLWQRRKTSEELRERLVEDARARVKLIQDWAAQLASPEAIVEAYAIPQYPDRPRLDLLQVLQFAQNTRAEVRARFLHSQFPDGTLAEIRPVANGVAIFAGSGERKYRHYVQINAWGMVHSELHISPRRETPEKPVFYPAWFVGHVDGFLQYLCRFYGELSSLLTKPMCLQVSLTVVPISYLVHERVFHLPEEYLLPLFDERIQLVKEVLLPHEVGRRREELVRGSAQRLLWAGGRPVDDTWVQRFVDYLYGRSGPAGHNAL